jgi:hypothetical protein
MLFTFTNKNKLYKLRKKDTMMTDHWSFFDLKSVNTNIHSGDLNATYNNNNNKHTVSVPMVYDWVRSTSTINIRVPFQCTNKNKGIAKVETYQYYATSDGIKSVYTNEDELKQYGSRGILDPATVSFINLFINGILQPPNQYIVELGRLTLTSGDVPEAGSPIILQFVRIKV